MDLSLDDYIVKKNPPVFKKNPRLGPKVSPGRANLIATNKNMMAAQKRNQPQGNLQQRPNFNVVGLGKKQNFDARQRLGDGAKQDARLKIMNKTKVVDARARILNRGGPQNPGVGLSQPKQRITGPGQRSGGQVQGQQKAAVSDSKMATLGSQDMRIKIQNAKAKKLDARQMIRARQAAKGITQTPQNQTQPQPSVTMTAQTRGPNHGVVGGGGDGFKVHAMGGSLQKTISSNNQPQPHPQPVQSQQTPRNAPLRKTIQNPAAIPTVSQRVGNNVVISPNENYSHQPVQQPQYQQQYTQQPQYTHTQMYSEPVPVPQYTQQYSQPLPPQYQQQTQMPVIRIQNDAYQQPPQPVRVAPPAPPPPPPPATQPSYDGSYYAKPEPIRSRTTASSSSSRAPSAVLQSRLGEDTSEVSVADISPLQGFRVMITNLHPIVTQNDIVELFGAVGALKKARLIRIGNAEVVFVRKEDALSAIRKYHNRELDGQPMQVVMTTSGTVPKQTESTHQPLQLPKSNSSGDSAPVDVDVGLLHKALFKTTGKEEAPSRPVTFTVKI